MVINVSKVSELNFNNILDDPDWDLPFFKKLAKNDTGVARGHQAGIVIPKDLRKYFPGLVGEITPENPTLDHRVKAKLFVDGQLLEEVDTRYQFQTWGGTRPPESRLTGNLPRLRNLAQGGDFLVIQRQLDNLNYYRLFLIRQKNPIYKWINKNTGNRNWGILWKESPMTQNDFEWATKEEEKKEDLEFELFDQEQRKIESRSKRVARSNAFQFKVKEIYKFTCCVCGTALKSMDGHFELDAAHIIPKQQMGSDDARNGLALCKRHHWAYDRGLFGIKEGRKVYVPEKVLKNSQNLILKELVDTKIIEPVILALKPHPKALEWHRKNVVVL